jgi:flagellar motility protein MotE (MotC chaperone)
MPRVQAFKKGVELSGARQFSLSSVTELLAEFQAIGALVASMDPKPAAAAMNLMAKEHMSKVMRSMPPLNAAIVLSLMDPGAVQKLTEALSSDGGIADHLVPILALCEPTVLAKKLQKVSTPMLATCLSGLPPFLAGGTLQRLDPALSAPALEALPPPVAGGILNHLPSKALVQQLAAVSPGFAAACMSCMEVSTGAAALNVMEEGVRTGLISAMEGRGGAGGLLARMRPGAACDVLLQVEPHVSKALMESTMPEAGAKILQEGQVTQLAPLVMALESATAAGMIALMKVNRLYFATISRMANARTNNNTPMGISIVTIS